MNWLRPWVNRELPDFTVGTLKLNAEALSPRAALLTIEYLLPRQSGEKNVQGAFPNRNFVWKQPALLGREKHKQINPHLTFTS